MDTTENKTEHFLRKPYPEFKPAKEGAYMTDYGLSFWAGRGWLRELKPIEPEYFFEPSPMGEVKDAQPPVISAPDFLKEKRIQDVVICKEVHFFDKERDLPEIKLSGILTEFAQRQGQKTNQNKL